MEERTPDHLIFLTPIGELIEHIPRKALQELVYEASGKQESSKYSTKDGLKSRVESYYDR